MEITANNLEFKSWEKSVISGAIFSCPLGSKTALVGPEGSGKKALLLMLGGYLKPTSGTVRLGDRDIFRDLDSYRRQVSLGEIEGINPLSPDMTVRENILFALELCGSKDRQNDADPAMDRLGLSVYADTKVRQLSPLLSAYTSLGCILVSEPSIVILDEPTKKLTSLDAESFWRKAEAGFKGKTVFFSTKDFREAEAHADKIIILECGRIIGQK